MKDTFVFCLVLALVTVDARWDFSDLLYAGTKISDVVVWRSRAYICAPRQPDSPYISPATLIVAPWPETLNMSSNFLRVGKARPFPNTEMQAYDVESAIQSAVSGDVDGKGRLFILDSGHTNLDPKVLVFDLHRGNRIITSSKLKGISGKFLRTLVIDSYGNKAHTGTRAYVGDPEGNRLIVFSLRDRKWWPVQLILGNTHSLTITPTSTDDAPMFISYELAISKRDPILYMTSPITNYLYSVNLKDIRDDRGPMPLYANDVSVNIRSAIVKNIGPKLGDSNGLLTDFSDGLHYYLPLSFASVRWDTTLPLTAEGYKVTLQSAQTLPSVENYFTDGQREVWAIVNRQASNNVPYSEPGPYCVLVQSYNN